MKTIDQLSGIADGVIGETEPVKPQFDVVVPQSMQVGRAADRQSVMVVFDAHTATQIAVALPRAGALTLATQILECEKDMQAEEAKNREPSKIMLPGLGAPLRGN
jgi:hypothetical protein